MYQIENYLLFRPYYHLRYYNWDYLEFLKKHRKIDKIYSRKIFVPHKNYIQWYYLLRYYKKQTRIAI